MARIEFNNVSVDFPIYNANSRSLKNHLIKVATGGQLNTDQQGRVLVRALENLTFTLQDGDRVGIIGHNGAGKSTLLRLLSGVYFPSEGNVRINGEIGSLIDISLGIDHEATGRENIYIRGSLLGLSKAVINKNIDEIIEFSELGGFADMPVRTYSSGMHLRLAFAVSTIVHPQILLMDEWLSVGDEGFKEKARARMQALVDKTSILVIASHSKEQLLQVCNRIIWLEHGRILMDGDASQVAEMYFSKKP
ncbi:ABC transporter ATP-binding protein [Methylotenera sp. G11]|uniref:ABC transporter ATP-binding protein n=1 Tax=Methylotenera sp. G11 TaxID=1506585 RepID=UPI000645C044|nr:ABC transporter ATP-binding protein [Methylotenera sp. G11]